MSITFDFIISLLNAWLMVYTFFLFYKSFADNRFSKLISAIYFFVLVLIFSFILYFIPLGLFRTILIVLLPFLTSFLCRFKPHIHILISLIAYGIAGVSELLTTAILSSIFSVSPQAATENFFEIIGIVLSKMIIICLISLFRFKKYKIAYSLPLSNVLLLCLIPLSSITIVILHSVWFIKIPYQSLSLSITNTISYLMLILSNILFFKIIDTMYKSLDKDKKIIVSQELIQSQTRQYQQLLEHNKNILRIQHDHKNFLIGIISELEHGNIDVVISALKEEQETVNFTNKIAENSNILTTVIKAKTFLAEENNIAIDVEYSDMKNINISSIDIAIILGNAIDNSIEALQRISLPQKTIHIFLQITNDLIIMSIKNPVLENIDTNNIISSKRKTGVGGIGILSMKQLAEKYGGEVILTCENFTFETYVVLRNSSFYDKS